MNIYLLFNKLKIFYNRIKIIKYFYSIIVGIDFIDISDLLALVDNKKVYDKSLYVLIDNERIELKEINKSISDTKKELIYKEFLNENKRLKNIICFTFLWSIGVWTADYFNNPLYGFVAIGVANVVLDYILQYHLKKCIDVVNKIEGDNKNKLSDINEFHKDE